MKSQMRMEFEARHGFEVCDDMDIQTSVAWDNWKEAWKAAMAHAKYKANECADNNAYTPAQKRALRHKQYVKLWTLIINVNDNGNAIEVDKIAYQRILFVQNCLTEMFAVKAVISYTLNHQLVDSIEQPANNIEFNSIVPGTIGKTLYDAAYKQRPAAESLGTI